VTELVPAEPVYDGEIVAEVVKPTFGAVAVREPLGLDHVQVHLVRSFEGACNLVRWFGERHPDGIGIDTETTGLSRERDRIRMIQFGDARQGWAVPIDEWRGLVHELIGKYDGIWNTHNGPFEVGMCRNDGIELPTDRIDDSRIMAHVLSSTSPLALKALSSQLIDPRAAYSQRRLEEALGRLGGWSWETIPLDYEPYWTYAALDPVLTTQVKSIMKPKVMAEAPNSYALELAVQWVTERMERRGVTVDRPYCQESYDRLAQYVTAAEAWCASSYGLYPGSTSKVIKILQDDGIKLTKRTKSGALSLDKEVLQEVIAETNHPLATVVLGRRQALKIANTNFKAYLDLSAYDGLIHSSINTIGGYAKDHFDPGGQGGVRTGRMSSNDPNLQNVPIRTPAGKRIRDAFVPRSEHVWLKSDFSQIEMRIMAMLSYPIHRGLQEAFTAGGDFFVNMARNVFHEPDFRKVDPRRQFVKNGGYAKIYGAGIDKFAKTIGADVPTAAAFMGDFDRAYPGIGKFMKQVEREALRNLELHGTPFVRSPLTNRQFTGDESAIYKLVNYLIQGTAAEVMKLKIVELDAAGLGPYMLFPVHDEIDLDVPIGILDDARRALVGVMNDDKIIAPVPLTASIATGYRWGSLEEED
jgi:DNA polymerase-1